MSFSRLRRLDGVGSGGEHADIQRLFDEIVALLRDAEALREQHHTDLLYDDLPVADVAVGEQAFSRAVRSTSR